MMTSAYPPTTRRRGGRGDHFKDKAALQLDRLAGFSDSQPLKGGNAPQQADDVAQRERRLPPIGREHADENRLTRRAMVGAAGGEATCETCGKATLSAPTTRDDPRLRDWPRRQNRPTSHPAHEVRVGRHFAEDGVFDAVPRRPARRVELAKQLPKLARRHLLASLTARRNASAGSTRRSRRPRATRLLAIDDRVGEIIKTLQERGFQSPYLRNFVVARIRPFRPRGKPAPEPDALLDHMESAAAKFDPGKVKEDQVSKAASGGD